MNCNDDDDSGISKELEGLSLADDGDDDSNEEEAPRAPPSRERRLARQTKETAVRRETTLAARRAAVKSRRKGIDDDDAKASLPDECTEHAQALKGSKLDEVLAALTYLRKLVSVETSPPIDGVLSLGILPIVLRWVVGDDDPSKPLSTDDVRERIRFEGGWLLCNLASGTAEQTQRLVDERVPQHLIDFLRRRTKAGDPTTTSEQIVWALGNFAGENAAIRDLLINNGIVDALLPLVDGIASLEVSYLRNVVWTVSNLFRGKPRPNLRKLKPLLALLLTVLNCSDSAACADGLWALSFLTDTNDNEDISLVVRAGCVPKIVALLRSSVPSVSMPALRTLGNIATGDDVHTQSIIDAGILPVIASLLKSNQKDSLLRELLWTLSNITAGNISQIQAFIDTPGLLNQVVNITTSKKAGNVRKEALFTLCNMVASGNIEQCRRANESQVYLALVSVVEESPEFLNWQMRQAAFEGLATYDQLNDKNLQARIKQLTDDPSSEGEVFFL